MLKMTGKLTKKSGLPPGTPVFVGEKKAEYVKITVIDYDKEHIETQVVQTVDECFPFKEKPTVTWINVDGIHDATIVEELGAHYGLHPLIIEDLLNTRQRLKVDIFDDYILGIYGMNFQVMPELTWRWGYFAVLSIMLGIGGALVVYFKKKNWL